ncbi:MAG: methyltransferase [Deltaproteobacteria bacterium]|nr:MAG: methyltransferase [Deltaproteobacteria bacterium]
MDSLTEFHDQYDTDKSTLTIRGRNFSFFVPKTLDRFLNATDLLNHFPLWAKIWEAAIVLADCLAGMTVDPQKRFLEIGSGLGVAGIVAASFGHRVMMTEYNADALNFARANAQNNRIASTHRLKITSLDWNNPQLQEPFDYIIGSEVIFREQDFQPILALFQTWLKPDGTIILAERVRKTTVEFFRRMGDYFEIHARKKILRSEDGEIRIILCRMRFRDPSAEKIASACNS